MMPQSDASPKELAKSRIDLAVPVAQRAQLGNVVLFRSNVDRPLAMDLTLEGTSVSHRVSDVRFGRQNESEIFFVLPKFVLKIIQEKNPINEAILTIAAEFVLIYSVDSFEGIAHANLEAFSLTSGIFHAWPYWREFVQSTTARMGVDTPITLPVFRIGDIPMQNEPPLRMPEDDLVADNSGTTGQ